VVLGHCEPAGHCVHSACPPVANEPACKEDELERLEKGLCLENFMKTKDKKEVRLQSSLASHD
jgi:hypothetical protein